MDEQDRSEVLNPDSYNGWKNYETWAVALWIDNDQGSYEQSRQLARDVLTSGQETRTHAGALADALQEVTTYEMPDLGASVWTDLLNAAVSEVDWYEIAENYLQDVSETV